MTRTKHDKDTQHVEISALDVIVRYAEQSFTENQLFYLADAFAELARNRRDEREQGEREES